MIELAHEIIKGQMRKYSGGYKSPEEIDAALYRSLLDFYNLLFTNSAFSQDLRRYLKEQVCNISSTNSFPVSADYHRPKGIYSKIGTKNHEGDILEEAEWLDRLNSYIIEPDLKNPIARIIDNKVEFHPNDEGNYVFVYYRAPIKPVFGYTVSENERNFIFSQGTSTELDVDQNSLNNVIVGALGYLGISLNEEKLLLEKKVSGN